MTIMQRKRLYDEYQYVNDLIYALQKSRFVIKIITIFLHIEICGQ